jgi:phage terminase small subunit
MSAEPLPPLSVCPDREKLTRRQRQFVSLYIREGNLKRIAERMHISKKTLYKWMTDPRIRKEIKRVRQRAQKKLAIHVYQVIEELKWIAFSDITDYVVDEKTGEVTVRNNDPRAIRAIEAIEFVTTETTKNGVTTATTRLKIKLWDKLEAMKTIARLLGWTTTNRFSVPQLETPKGTGTIRPPEFLEKMLRCKPTAYPDTVVGPPPTYLPSTVTPPC